MKIFYDTEFTGHSEDPGLISVGLVTLEGQELYIEMTDGWDQSDCSDFCMDHILPLMGDGEQLTRAKAAARIVEWLQGLVPGGSLAGVELIADTTWDDWLLRPLLDRFVKKLPKPEREGLEYVFLAFPESRRQEVFFEAYDLYFTAPQRRQHHALEDARALREAWKVAKAYR